MGSGSRFGYINYDEAARARSDLVRRAFERCEAELLLTTEGRSRSLALTKLEEAFMWAGKAIRDDQGAREAMRAGGAGGENGGA